MIGVKLGLLLVLTVFATATASLVHADGILVDFDKLEYNTGDSITITGYVTDLKMPVIAISIFDPDGTILSANSIEIDSDGLFEKTMRLDSPFYDKPGDYKVKLDYGKISQNEYFTIVGDASVPEIPKQPTLIEITSLATDKPKYTDGDTIKISGTVSTLDSPTVLIGIYDTFGGPAGFYFGQVTPDLKFSTSFLAMDGVNFKVDGTYSIKAHFGESSKTISFDFVSKTDEPVKKVPDTTNKPATTTNNDNTIIKTSDTAKENTPTTNNNSIIQNTPATQTPNKPNNPVKDTSQQDKEKKLAQTKQEDNLSVEDIELGLMLNQINLNCDSRSRFTDTITYYDGMGPALYRLCKFDSSLNFFNDSLSEDPNNVEILTNKGSALGKLGRISEAITYYDMALSIDSDFLPAINNKANALANMGQYNEAKRLYVSAIEKNPNYTTATKNLSILNSQIIESTTQVTAKEPIQKVSYETSNNVNKINNFDENKSQQNEEPLNIFEEISEVFSSLFGFLK